MVGSSWLTRKAFTLDPTPSIDVGAITLSALDIKNEDFLNGNYVFSGQARVTASVVNEGRHDYYRQTAALSVLAGDYVNNTGVITATLGTVVLACRRTNDAGYRQRRPGRLRG